MRKALIDARFGRGAFLEWSRLDELQQAPGTAFADAMKDPKVRQRFNNVAAALSERLE
jgi:hypothetical protein